MIFLLKNESGFFGHEITLRCRSCQLNCRRQDVIRQIIKFSIVSNHVEQNFSLPLMIEEKHWLSKLQTLSPTKIASVYLFLRSHSYGTNLFTWTKVYNLILPSALSITCIVLVSRLQKSPCNLCWWVFRKPELRCLARLWILCSNGALISASVR